MRQWLSRLSMCPTKPLRCRHLTLGADMSRREFMVLIGGASFASSFAARAQSRKQNRIALVHSGIPAEQLTETAGPRWVRRFYETLRKLGHLEGDNIVVERYSAEGR